MKHNSFSVALLGVVLLPCAAFAQVAPPQQPVAPAPHAPPVADAPPAPRDGMDAMPAPGDDAPMRDGGPAGMRNGGPEDMRDGGPAGMRPGARMDGMRRGAPPRPGMGMGPRDDMNGPGMNNMAPAPVPAPATISVEDGYVFVVQGDTLFQYSVKGLKLVQRTRLEQMPPAPMQATIMRPRPMQPAPRVAPRP